MDDAAHTLALDRVNRQRANRIDTELIDVHLALCLTHIYSCRGQEDTRKLNQALDAPGYGTGDGILRQNGKRCSFQSKSGLSILAKVTVH